MLIGVTGGALAPRVGSYKREFGFGVIEANLRPIDVAMTGLATNAQLPSVWLLFLMTGRTRRR